MKRPSLIVSGALVGFVGLLGYRAMAPPGLTFVVTPSVSSSATTVPRATDPTTSAPPPQHSTTTTRTPHTTTTQGRATPPPTTLAPIPTTTAPSAARSATGDSVNYIYGVLSVTVTTSGSEISNVKIGSLQDGGNYLSASIDQSAIPQLEQQALAAQSSNIQGVSGASYTSAGFRQSLQSALSKLGL
jgi:uncharacterized protein with FMN-binding domain